MPEPTAAPPAAPAAPPAAPAAPPAAPAPAPGGDDILATPVAPVPVDFKVPEGMKPDDTLLASFKPLVSELKLDSAGAQKLVDLYASTIKAQAEASDKAWSAQQKAWREEVVSDPEIGGAKFESTKAAVKTFFDAFDKDGSIRKVIGELGLSNHPALVRLAVRGAAALSEDGVAAPRAPAAADMSEDEELRLRYPSMFKDK